MEPDSHYRNQSNGQDITMLPANSFLGSELRRRRRAWHDLRDTLIQALPPDYLQHVIYGVVNPNSIDLFADSPAWSAKLRFYDSEIIKVYRHRHGVKIRKVTCRTIADAGKGITLTDPA